MSQDSLGKHLCALLVARAPITGLESSQGPHCPREKGQNPDLPSVPAPCCPISLDILMGDVPVGHPPLLPNCACCTLPHRSPEYPVLHPMPMTTSNSTLCPSCHLPRSISRPENSVTYERSHHGLCAAQKQSGTCHTQPLLAFLPRPPPALES